MWRTSDSVARKVASRLSLAEVAACRVEYAVNIVATAVAALPTAAASSGLPWIAAVMMTMKMTEPANTTTAAKRFDSTG